MLVLFVLIISLFIFRGIGALGVSVFARVISNPMAVVYFTGVCEILGAIGILIPRTRSLAGLCLVIFLLAILPANIKAAGENLTIGGRTATALWQRIPMQILLLVLISWSTQPRALFSSFFAR